MLCKTNKTEYDDLPLLSDIWIIKKETKTTHLLIYLISFNDICQHTLNLNFMPATHFKQVKTEATKDWEHCGMFKKHLFGTFPRWAGSSVPWLYMKTLSCSQERTRSCSPLWNTWLCEGHTCQPLEHLVKAVVSKHILFANTFKFYTLSQLYWIQGCILTTEAVE